MQLKPWEGFEWENDDPISIFKRSFRLLWGGSRRRNRGSAQEAFSVVKPRNNWLLTGVEERNGWICDVFGAGVEVLIGILQNPGGWRAGSGN